MTGLSAPHPLPRPYRDGPARVHVGLKPLVGPWIRAGISAEKRVLLAGPPGAVFAAVEGSEAGQAEALAVVSRALGLAAPEAGTPLLGLAGLVEDDPVLMERRAGAWTCTAACLCAPTFFSVQHAVGQSLGGLHGPVPGGDPGLAGRIARVFDGLRPGLVLERHNWTVQAGPERHTPDGAFLRARARAAGPEAAAGLLHLRVERQTLSLLPDTGAVLFTIGVTVERLADILAEAGEAGVFARAMADTPVEVAAYKGWPGLAHLIKPLVAAAGVPSLRVPV